MKKLTVFILAAALAFSMAFPALAVDDLDPPLYEQFGYKSLEEMLADYSMTEEEYASWVENYRATQEYEEGFKVWLAEYLAAHPDCEKEVLAKRGEYWKTEYGYDTKAEMAEDWGLEVDALDEYMLTSFLRTDLYDLYAQEYLRKVRDEGITALGGVPGELGVMLDGLYIKFPDAKPEIVSGRTMVPVRAVAESFGAEVGWDDETRMVTLTKDDKVIYFEAGDDEITLKTGEETTKIQMDVACYIKDGRTYVPVRFFAETLGLDVFWDSDYYTAVLIDKEAFIKKADSAFSILDGLMKSRLDYSGENVRGTARMTLSILRYDTINGNRSGDAYIAVDTAVGKTGISEKISMKGFGVLVAGLLGDILELDEDSEAAMILTILNDMETELLMDLEGGNFYVLSPALNTLLSKSLDVSISPSAWLLIPMGDDTAELEKSMDMFYGSGAGLPSIGELVYNYASASMSALCPFNIYASLSESLESIAAVVGDQSFTAQAGGYSWNMTTEEANALLFSMGAYETPEVFNLSMEAYSSGRVDFKGEYLESSEMPNIRVTASGTSSKYAASATMKIQVQNAFDITLSLDSSASLMSAPPRVTPPDGAEIFEVSELSGTPDIPTDSVTGGIFDALAA